LSVDLIFKIAGLGILVAIIYIILKQAGREELGHLVALVGVVIVLVWVIQLVRELFDTVRAVFDLY